MKISLSSLHLFLLVVLAQHVGPDRNSWAGRFVTYAAVKRQAECFHLGVLILLHAHRLSIKRCLSSMTAMIYKTNCVCEPCDWLAYLKRSLWQGWSPATLEPELNKQNKIHYMVNSATSNWAPDLICWGHRWKQLRNVFLYIFVSFCNQRSYLSCLWAVSNNRKKVTKEIHIIFSFYVKMLLCTHTSTLAC